mmetsp:Transcript_84433/g.247629  ORF Transcript_84433/g.247629 Transcript_84433/m.247629 type:complete len:570 (+) Transcript_84433:160-1869(+)
MTDELSIVDVSSAISDARTESTTSICDVDVRQAWGAESQDAANKDVHFLCTGRAETFLASAAGGAFLLSGLLLLGCCECGAFGYEDSVTLTVRAVAWICTCLLPYSIVSSNQVGYLLYEIDPSRKGWAGQLVFFGLTPSNIRKHVAASMKRAVAATALFNGFPLLLSLVLLVVPLQNDRGYLGVVVLYLVGCMLGRIVVGKNLTKILPPPAERVPFFASMMKIHGLSNICFFALCTVLGVARSLLGPALGPVLAVTMGLYEFGTVFHIHRSFVKFYVANPGIRRSYAHTQPGAMASVFVNITHCNAEGVRLALLMCSMSGEHAGLTLGLSLAASLAFNTLSRTGWMLMMVRVLSCGRFWNSNAVVVLNHNKFHMGYPRFFAWAAVVLVRTSVGHGLRYVSMADWAGILQLVEEVVEDLLVWGVSSCGLSAKVPFPPAPEAHKPAGAAATQAAGFDAVHPDPGSGDLGEGGSSRGSEHDAQGGASLEAQAAAHETLRQFKHQMQPAFSVLPFWAHLTSVFAPQLHFTLCLVIFGGGVNRLLGLCHEEGYTGIGRGLVWWPVLDGSDRCGL